ncbi:MAG: hypothetical protein CYG60_17195 [Actinobacteria bacterium]|nr:MAG: hypothetical protein CYG60_17195 [Actinomycetota bacterium]
MGEASITYFPVRNGDTSRIRLSDGTDIVVDCNITEESRDHSVKERYDVHAHLAEEARKENGVPHVDAFILTHPDTDHCRGFKDTFYAGDPAQYGDEAKKNGLIIIDELWFTPRIFSPHEEGKLAPSAKVFLKEARRRRSLYLSGSLKRDKPGNRLRIVGYTGSGENEGLEGIVTIPGKTISKINGKTKQDFSFFVHAPFKKNTDSEDGERNDTSVVLQARFDVGGEWHACLAFFGGDAGCAVWRDVLDRSENESLRWDLFLAPHHVSWGFFSEERHEDNPEPSESSLAVLGKRRAGAVVVGSCKPIKDDGDNPPNPAAAEQYEGAVGDSNFLVTSEIPDEDEPLPLVFIMSKRGLVRDSSPTSPSRRRTTRVTTGAAATVRTYG